LLTKDFRKFFGKNDAPAKQQSKLSFSTKTKTEKKHAEPKEEPESSPAEVKTEPAATAESNTNVKEKTNGDAMEVDSSPAEAGKKRQVKEEEEDSEDEPPTKRQRRKPAKETESTKVVPAPKKAEKPATIPKAAAKPKVVKEEVDEDKNEAPKPKKATKGKKEAHKSPTPVTEDDAALEAKQEEEDVLSSGEEPEEVKKEARKKVQATLTSKTKDLYPDWKAGEPVPYAALCTTFSKIEMTTKRLEILAHCSLFLRQVMRLTPAELLPTVLLMINKLAADYAGIELGIGESLIMKAISESTGRTLQHIKSDQQEIGDLGLVAAKSRSKQPTMFKPKPLTVAGVHKGLMAIATTTEGQGAQGRKVDGIKKLLSAADAHNAGKAVDIEENKGGASEAKFIVRTLEGKLRLGLAEKTVVVALAQAVKFHEMSQEGKTPSTEDLAKAEAMLKTVYSELPSYEVIVPAMLEHGLSNLRENCRLQPGVPLKPMLAKPTKSITEVLDRFEGKDFTCEYKYDGERAQIHYVAHDSTEEMATAAPAAGKSDRGVSNIFSRNSEDLSKKYPDILAKLPTWVKQGTKSFVLDCETVAWDMVEKKVLPFQQLMTRKRKDVKVEDVKVKVCVFAFDILYLNGEVSLCTLFVVQRANALRRW
jgi:DNA ligase-1